MSVFNPRINPLPLSSSAYLCSLANGDMDEQMERDLDAFSVLNASRCETDVRCVREETSEMTSNPDMHSAMPQPPGQ